MEFLDELGESDEIEIQGLAGMKFKKVTTPLGRPKLVVVGRRRVPYLRTLHFDFNGTAATLADQFTVDLSSQVMLYSISHVQALQTIGAWNFAVDFTSEPTVLLNDAGSGINITDGAVDLSSAFVCTRIGGTEGQRAARDAFEPYLLTPGSVLRVTVGNMANVGGAGVWPVGSVYRIGITFRGVKYTEDSRAIG